MGKLRQGLRPRSTEVVGWDLRCPQDTSYHVLPFRGTWCKNTQGTITLKTEKTRAVKVQTCGFCDCEAHQSHPKVEQSGGQTGHGLCPVSPLLLWPRSFPKPRSATFRPVFSRPPCVCLALLPMTSSVAPHSPCGSDLLSLLSGPPWLEQRSPSWSPAHWRAPSFFLGLAASVKGLLCFPRNATRLGGQARAREEQVGRLNK